MNRLLAERYTKMFKSKIFWICMAAMVGCGIFVTSKFDPRVKLDVMVYSFTMFIGFAMAVFCTMFVESGYSDGTIRNKLIIGHNRSTIFLANVLVCFSAGLLFVVSYLLPVLLIGAPHPGWFKLGAEWNIKTIIVCLFILIAFACIFTTISMLLSTRAVPEVICLLIVVLFMVISMVIKMRLGAPQQITACQIDESGKTTMVTRDNPDYISGTKREAYEFILESTPSGQCIKYNFGQDFVLARCIICDTVLSVVFAGAGLLLFRKKNIN